MYFWSDQVESSGPLDFGTGHGDVSKVEKENEHPASSDQQRVMSKQ